MMKAFFVSNGVRCKWINEFPGGSANDKLPVMTMVLFCVEKVDECPVLIVRRNRG
jgi:hypothetical protein